MQMPEELEYRTADTIAECLDGVSSEMYTRLWQILNDAENPTPLGGDGTDGTVETPDMQLDSANDDKTPHWWGKLTEEEQQHLVDCCKAFEEKHGFTF